MQRINKSSKKNKDRKNSIKIRSKIENKKIKRKNKVEQGNK